MICKNCGAKIAKNSFFCDNCGRSIGTVEELVEFNRNERRHKRKVRTTLTTTALIVGVCSFIAGKAYFTKETVKPSKTPEPTFAAVVKTEVTVQPVQTSELTEIAEQTPIITAVPTITATIVPTIKPTITPTLVPTAKPTIIPTPVIAEQPAPTVQPVQVQTVNASDSSYIFPSDTTLLTPEKLASYSKAQLRLIRNEIYARHGYCFKHEDLKQYFASKTWYKPNPSLSTTQVFARFNETERRNNKLIIEYEKVNG